MAIIRNEYSSIFFCSVLRSISISSGPPASNAFRFFFILFSLSLSHCLSVSLSYTQKRHFHVINATHLVSFHFRSKIMYMHINTWRIPIIRLYKLKWRNSSRAHIQFDDAGNFWIVYFWPPIHGMHKQSSALKKNCRIDSGKPPPTSGVVDDSKQQVNVAYSVFVIRNGYATSNRFACLHFIYVLRFMSNQWQ